jgi:hypothetical protein
MGKIKRRCFQPLGPGPHGNRKFLIALRPPTVSILSKLSTIRPNFDKSGLEVIDYLRRRSPGGIKAAREEIICLEDAQRTDLNGKVSKIS